MLKHALVLLILGIPIAGCTSGPVHCSIVNEDVLLEDLAREPRREAVLVDIDDTMVSGGLGTMLRLYLDVAPGGAKPFRGAPEAIRALSERYDVVLLTARSTAVRDETIEWLEESGFPRLPVVFCDRVQTCSDCQEDYKSRAIAQLRAKGLRPVWGIGDRWSDMGAYARNGLAAWLILDGYGDADWARSRPIFGMRSWGSGAHAPKYRVSSTQDGAWDGIREALIAEAQQAPDAPVLVEGNQPE